MSELFSLILIGSDFIHNFLTRRFELNPITKIFSNRDKGTPEEKGNATADALSLSLKYNFVTPLTSMVVTKPEDETNDNTFTADKLTEGMTKLSNSKQKFAKSNGNGT